MDAIRYVKTVGTYLFKDRDDNQHSSGKVSLLLGARLHVDLSQNIAGRVPAETMLSAKGKKHEGFVDLDKLSEKQQLKVFFMDVGQGDATLIEAEGAIVIIDGGPNKGFHTKLVERFKNLVRAEEQFGLVPKEQLFINAIIISHFDLDHYYGLVKLLKDKRFKVGCIYHNGLPRFSDFDLKFLNLGDKKFWPDLGNGITTELRDLDSARRLLNQGYFRTSSGNENKFAKLLNAMLQAHNDGRLQKISILNRRDPHKPVKILPNTGDLRFEILAPLTMKTKGPLHLPTFPNPHTASSTAQFPAPSESHTINGNSIVLRLIYKQASFLFGGDLNQPAQKFLEQRYSNLNAFKSAVNKACHHGSSDFHLNYLRAVSPDATVFSSGDNGSYDHPLPDAMGAAAKHSQGDYPLVFSTELARETSSKKGIKYGNINARSNGQETVLAQKKEKPSLNQWHSFKIPYQGPFYQH
ncbi:ComEC/Rec2 family competence protein [Kangiella sp. TOML190]|uniref:ComEC/Rec2 family competence protein n=1 Tax=Kangiella sp. TOML190 TaxID=2931351 RepID=UPI00203F6BC0|nr:MBL fold metallo-hydrolase [Kangiella sp. TOML190]